MQHLGVVRAAACEAAYEVVLLCYQGNQQKVFH